LGFDLDRVLRRIKPQKIHSGLARRPAEMLPFVEAHLRPGPELLLDTTVYIDTLQDRSPPSVDELLKQRVCNHCSICLAELTHAFGRLNPAHPATEAALASLRSVIHALPAHRLQEPSTSAWGTAGILAGLAFRLGGYQPGQERRLLNDALLFLYAYENGYTVLSANMRDFDILNQLVPDGRILLYQPLAR
jgi:predicted nucleic acid-binding protein